MSTSHVGDPREHAIVDTAMLRDRGLNQKQIERLVRTGRLYRVEQGVFTTSPPEGDLLLRALCHRRPALVFTGRTALELHEGREITLPVQAVVLPGKSLSGPATLTLRRRKAIRFQHVRGLKVTLGAVSVADAEDMSDADLIAHLEDRYAGRAGKIALEAEMGTISRVPARLRHLIARASIGADSDAERQVFRELRARGIRVDQNRQIGGYFFDGVIEEGRVIVEVDGYRFHSAENRETFIRDRWKANYATRRGYRVLRYTGSCVRYHLDEVVEQIIAAVEGLDEELPTEAHPVWSWHETLVRDGSWWQEVAQ
ncbi:DUF559 domain-containing protein [Corynebacterium suedekumii]|uniref:DUF559 domain-containing protein n=1 Tax=Corynebacterium suedekumii TaxID=3049801 RepID=A0ABY8VPU9_9CORY|nr:DUF559 domain-containing protein [Corynebacterium suedekumii]WIM71107.1 DUF559 domain-containing protein [Corynebacterium suedekumii]